MEIVSFISKAFFKKKSRKVKLFWNLLDKIYVEVSTSTESFIRYLVWFRESINIQRFRTSKSLDLQALFADDRKVFPVKAKVDIVDLWLYNEFMTTRMDPVAQEKHNLPINVSLEFKCQQKTLHCKVTQCWRKK